MLECTDDDIIGTNAMKLKTITLTNFRCFRSSSVDLDERLTVLVARNGAGKTAFLDAIAIGLGEFISRLDVPATPRYDNRFDRDNIRVAKADNVASYATVSIVSKIQVDTSNDAEIDEKGEKIEWDKILYPDKSRNTRQKVLRMVRQDRKNNDLPPLKKTKELNNHVDQYIDAFNRDDSFTLPVLAYYGTGRSVFDVLMRLRNPEELFPRFSAFYHALDVKTDFKRSFEYLTYLDHLRLSEIKEREDFGYKLPQLETIWRAIKLMIEDVSNPRIKLAPPRFSVDWHHGDKTKKDLKLQQLSDGYRTTLAMVMDLASRMAQANPDMDDPLQTTGIVLIDEVDLHLHPGWQQTILPDLLRTFPNVQFIVTTHSPQVLTTVPHESIRVIDWKNGEPVIKSVPFSEGAEAQQLLNDVLGVDSRPQNIEIVDKLNRYSEFVNRDKWDLPEAKKLRKELDLWGNAYEPELARLDMDIRLLARQRKMG